MPHIEVLIRQRRVLVVMCVHLTSVEKPLAFVWEVCFKRGARRESESSICVDLHVCGIGLWSLSAGPRAKCSSPHSETL